MLILLYSSLVVSLIVGVGGESSQLLSDSSHAVSKNILTSVVSKKFADGTASLSLSLALHVTINKSNKSMLNDYEKINVIEKGAKKNPPPPPSTL